MIIETDPNYGADADGNRGRKVTTYELEPSDYEPIAVILNELGFTSEDTGVREIEYEDIEIEVTIEEYRDMMRQLERME